jgi:enoyl-CoA hydratase/carnithine racemase
MSEYQTIRCETHDGVARITLARPEKRNAMNAAMFQELGEATQHVGDDDAIRLVIVAGEGPSFCAGIDLGALAGLAGAARERFREFVGMAQRPYRLLASMRKPVIAAVQGHAIGAGFQLALACDLRVAAPDASFAMLEGRYGLVPDLGGSHHLARLIGVGRAKELVWTARTVAAEEAVAIGLVNRLATAGDLHAATDALAEEILTLAPLPQFLSKDLIARAAETPLEAEFDREAEAQLACLASADHREAVAAFLERRPPTFTGR